MQQTNMIIVQLNLFRLPRYLRNPTLASILDYTVKLQCIYYNSTEALAKYQTLRYMYI